MNDWKLVSPTTPCVLNWPYSHISSPSLSRNGGWASYTTLWPTSEKPSPRKGRGRRLSADEEKALFQACDHHSNPMLGWIARTALYTGMRAGEIKSLTRSQVDLDKRTVHLTETKNGSSRTVPLTRQATDVFRAVLNNPVRSLDTDLIFWGEPGRDSVRRPYEFYPAWARTLKRTGIEDLRFHDLRHEALSRLIEAGLGDQEVSAISRHKSMQMLKRYTHLRVEDLVDRSRSGNGLNKHLDIIACLRKLASP